jgi:hypothetical protein
MWIVLARLASRWGWRCDCINRFACLFACAVQCIDEAAMFDERGQALCGREPSRGLDQCSLSVICQPGFHEAHGSAKRQLGQCSRAADYQNTPDPLRLR